jgi:hypothetical protein
LWFQILLKIGGDVVTVTPSMAPTSALTSSSPNKHLDKMHEDSEATEDEVEPISRKGVESDDRYDEVTDDDERNRVEDQETEDEEVLVDEDENSVTEDDEAPAQHDDVDDSNQPAAKSRRLNPGRENQSQSVKSSSQTVSKGRGRSSAKAKAKRKSFDDDEEDEISDGLIDDEEADPLQSSSASSKSTRRRAIAQSPELTKFVDEELTAELDDSFGGLDEFADDGFGAEDDFDDSDDDRDDEDDHEEEDESRVALDQAAKLQILQAQVLAYSKLNSMLSPEQSFQQLYSSSSSSSSSTSLPEMGGKRASTMYRMFYHVKSIDLKAKKVRILCPFKKYRKYGSGIGEDFFTMLIFIQIV